MRFFANCKLYNFSAIKQDLDNLMEDVKIKSKVLQDKLNGIQSYIKNLHICFLWRFFRNLYYITDFDSIIKQEEAKITNNSYIPASLRMKKIHYTSISLDFVEVITDYDIEQEKYRDRCRDRIKRQLHICM
jgi:t-SNARE complex subunit (syntaxin)